MKSLPIVQPILPVDRKHFPTDSGWIYELKYDGFRGILYARKGLVWILTKSGKHHPAFSDLERRLSKHLRDSETILDGEVCCLDARGYPVRRDIPSNKDCLVLIAFDILWLDGEDLRGLPLKERKKILGRFVKREMRDSIQLASFIEGAGIVLFRLAYERGLEGVIAKRFKDPYSSAAEWLKIKNPDHRPAKPAHIRPKSFTSHRS